MELAAEDPEQGVVFYTIDQQFSEKPVFHRRDDCLSCHNSYNAAGVPGMLLRSVFTARDGTALFQLGSYNTDHRARWSSAGAAGT